jgi:hypothetical protein
MISVSLNLQVLYGASVLQFSTLGMLLFLCLLCCFAVKNCGGSVSTIEINTCQVSCRILCDLAHSGLDSGEESWCCPQECELNSCNLRPWLLFFLSVLLLLVLLLMCLLICCCCCCCCCCCWEQPPILPVSKWTPWRACWRARSLPWLGEVARGRTLPLAGG